VSAALSGVRAAPSRLVAGGRLASGRPGPAGIHRVPAQQLARRELARSIYQPSLWTRLFKDITNWLNRLSIGPAKGGWWLLIVLIIVLILVIAGVLYRIGGRAGGPGLRAHWFRHLWAHRVQAAGMDLVSILTLGGWASPSQLTTRYGAALKESRAIEAARRIPLRSGAL